MSVRQIDERLLLQNGNCSAGNRIVDTKHLRYLEHGNAVIKASANLVARVVARVGTAAVGAFAQQVDVRLDALGLRGTLLRYGHPVVMRKRRRVFLRCFGLRIRPQTARVIIFHVVVVFPLQYRVN